MAKKRKRPAAYGADLEVLLYAGWMGHACVGVSSSPEGMRRLKCETNTLEEAQEILKREKDAVVYGKDSGGCWRELWRAT